MGTVSKKIQAWEHTKSFQPLRENHKLTASSKQKTTQLSNKITACACSCMYVCSCEAPAQNMPTNQQFKRNHIYRKCPRPTQKQYLGIPTLIQLTISDKMQHILSQIGSLVEKNKTTAEGATLKAYYNKKNYGLSACVSHGITLPLGWLKFQIAIVRKSYLWQVPIEKKIYSWISFGRASSIQISKN